jgi:ParB-like chromosome segregation protein Spo0J
VTPGLARLLLTHNHIENRKRDARRVRDIAEAIGQGRLVDTSPIEFDEELNLINGQHRLRAVIEAGCSVQMQVVWRESLMV